MQDEAEEPVATLVFPTEYAYHLNQIAGVTSHHVIFLKRKFVSRLGHELVRFPITSCATVKYFDERPLLTVVFGGFLTLLIASVVVALLTTWDRLEPRMRIPIGALVLAGAYGLRFVFKSRRHRLVFILKDKTKLEWRSRPGDYDIMKLAAERVVEFARSREMLQDPRLTRT